MINKRKKSWINSVVCATPEITRNDLERNMIDIEQFIIVIFYESHRAVGDYAYTGIARHFKEKSLILGMTATLPSEKVKATEIIVSLGIQNILQRSDESPDVQPYIQKTNTEWIMVDLPPEMKAIQKCLQIALDERYTTLRKNGIQIVKKKSMST